MVCAAPSWSVICKWRTSTTPHTVAPLPGTGAKTTSSNTGNNKWTYGDANTGNLLGTIKSLDELGPISLNCTENAGTKIHEETLHCEWGLVSRSGWSIYDDSANYCLGAGDWWDGASEAAANVAAKDICGFFHGACGCACANELARSSECAY